MFAARGKCVACELKFVYRIFDQMFPQVNERSTCAFNGKTVFPSEIGLRRLCSDFRTVLFSLEDKNKFPT